MDDYLLRLAVAGLKNEVPPVPESGTDWEKLTVESVKQQIYPLVYTATSKLPDDNAPSGELKKKTREMFSASALRYATFDKVQKRIYDSADENSVNLIILKGAHLKDLYPSPELRTMGDMDVLAEKGKYEETSAFFRSLGFTGEERHEGQEDRLFMKNAPVVELFKDLSFDYVTEFDVSEPYREGLLNYKGHKHVFTMSERWQIAYSFMHFSKHLSMKGSGVRYLFDLYLMLTNYSKSEIDGAKTLIEGFGLGKLYGVILSVLGKYFALPDAPEFDSLARELTEYMLSVGAYGISDDTAYMRKKVQKEGKVKAIFSSLFPPFSMMKDRYGCLKRLPVLLPVFWVVRWITFLFSGKKTKKYADTVLGSGDTEKLLQKLGIAEQVKNIR